MNHDEVTIILNLMRVNWPNMLKGDKALQHAILLWTLCLHNVPFNIAQLALFEVCKTCKYPPSICDFKTAADAIENSISVEAENAYRNLRWGIIRLEANGATQAEIYESLPPKTRSALTNIGGLSAFAFENNGRLLYHDFINEYMVVERSARLRALPSAPPAGTKVTLN